MKISKIVKMVGEFIKRGHIYKDRRGVSNFSKNKVLDKKDVCYGYNHRVRINKDAPVSKRYLGKIGIIKEVEWLYDEKCYRLGLKMNDRVSLLSILSKDVTILLRRDNDKNYY